MTVGVEALPARPRDIPPLWLFGALVAMWPLDRLAPLAELLAPPWARLGWVVIAGAVVLLLASAWRFHAVGTGIRPFSPAVALVANGPFRLTRNPMYVGLVGVACGAALCWGSLGPHLASVALWWVLDRRFVRREEVFLRGRFGAAYDAYCHRVRRWL